MSILGNFRADQQITQLMSETDPNSQNALNLMGRLKKAGPKAIPKLIEAQKDEDERVKRLATWALSQVD